MQPPKVQSIEQIVAEQSGAYQPGIDLIGKKQALLPEKFKAAQMGLEGKKTLGFNQINNQATGRGMSFSGIPLDEQAQYLASEYLPGMQNLQYQQNEEEMALTGALAEIEKERRLGAFSTRERQQGTLEDYLREQRQMEWDREKMNIEMAQRRAEQAQRQAEEQMPTWQDALKREFEAQRILPGQKDFALERAMSTVMQSYGELDPNEVYANGYTMRRNLYGY